MKKLVEDCRMKFREGAIKNFQKHRHYGRYALCSLLQNKKKNNVLQIYLNNIGLVEYGFGAGGMCCSGNSIEIGGSKIKSIMGKVVKSSASMLSEGVVMEHIRKFHFALM